MKPSEMSMDQILAVMDKHKMLWENLQEELITRARLQGISEKQYDLCVNLLKESMDFVRILQAGQIVTEQQMARRNELLRQAHRLIVDISDQ